MQGGLTWTKSLDFPIIAPDGSKIFAHNVTENQWKERQSKHGVSDWCWLYSEETIERFRKEGRLVFYKKNDGTYNVKLKKYFKVDSTGQAIERRQNIRSILLDFLNSQGTKELNSIFNTIRKFEAPKPVDLIKYILKSYYTNDFIALDFFAGSGTTGQAVLELNKEDGGKRQFILCTINEKDIPEKVTRERLLRVMTGKTSDGKSNFPWIERNKPLGDSLDVYRIESIKNNSREIFNKINVDDYDQKFINEEWEQEWKNKKLNDINKKREWICSEFEETCKINK